MSNITKSNAIHQIWECIHVQDTIEIPLIPACSSAILDLTKMIVDTAHAVSENLKPTTDIDRRFHYQVTFTISSRKAVNPWDLQIVLEYATIDCYDDKSLRVQRAEQLQMVIPTELNF